MGLFNKSRELVTIKDWKPLKGLIELLGIPPTHLLQLDGFWLPIYQYIDTENYGWVRKITPQNLLAYWYKYNSDRVNSQYIPASVNIIGDWTRYTSLDDFPEEVTGFRGDFYNRDYIYYATDKPGVRCKVNLVVSNMGYYLKLLFILHMLDYNLRFFDSIKVTLYHGGVSMLENSNTVPWLDSIGYDTVLFIDGNEGLEGIKEFKHNCNDGESDRHLPVRIVDRAIIKDIVTINDVHRILQKQIGVIYDET